MIFHRQAIHPKPSVPAWAILLLAVPAAASAATLGYTGTGNSTDNFNNAVRGNVFTAATSFTATTFNLYLPSVSTGQWTAAVYSANASTNEPENILGDTGVRGSSTSGWNSVSLSSAVAIVAGNKYYLAVQFEDATDINQDNSGGTRWRLEGYGGPGWPNPFPSATAGPSYTYSLYVSGPEYTPTSTPAIPPTPTPSRTPTRTFTRTPTQSATWTLTPSATRTSTPSGTLTPTPTASSTMTPTFTPSSTPSGSPSHTRTCTVTATFTPFLSPTSTPQVSATSSPTVVRTLTPVYPGLGGKGFVAYPVPAINEIYFAWEEADPEAAQVEVFNVTGERVTTLRAPTPGRQLRWEISDLAPGVYLYRVTLSVNGAERSSPLRKFVVVK